MRRAALATLLLALGVGPVAGPAVAERISDIRNTLHNLSVTGPAVRWASWCRPAWCWCSTA